MQARKLTLGMVGCVALGLLASGCMHMPGGLTDSTQPTCGRQYTILQHTSATDSRICLLGLIPITGSNSIRDALNAAIRKGNADALIDVTVEGYSQYWILFTRDVTSVEGTAIRFVK